MPARQHVRDKVRGLVLGDSQPQVPVREPPHDYVGVIEAIFLYGFPAQQYRHIADFVTLQKAGVAGLNRGKGMVVKLSFDKPFYLAVDKALSQPLCLADHNFEKTRQPFVVIELKS
jgi:hypothetical protein